MCGKRENPEPILDQALLDQRSRDAEEPPIAVFWITAIGFGLYLSWVMIGITPSVFSGFNMLAIALFNDAELYGRIGGILPLALVGVLLVKRPEIRISQVMIVAVGALVSLGTLVVYLTVALFSANQGTEAVAVASLTLSALFVAMWGKALCAFAVKNVLKCIVAAHAFAFALVCLCSVSPPLVQASMHVFAPFLSCVALLSRSFAYSRENALGPAVSDSRGALDSKAAVEGREGARMLPESFRALLGIGLFGVIMQLLFQFSESKSASPNEFLWIAAGLVTCAIVMACALLSPRGLKITAISKLVLPLFVIGEFFIFAVDFDQRPMEVFVMGCAWVYFRFFYWMTWWTIAKESALPAACVFAIGQILLACGGLVGGLLCRGVLAFELPSFFVLGALCVLAIAIFLLCFDSRRVPGASVESRPLFDPKNEALCEKCADVAMARFGFSRQERVIAVMIVRGDDNVDIHQSLVITKNTLRTHLRNMYKKAGVHNREELVVLLRSFA